ncbi:MAG: RdgB/HAM1 family non-canonical purine NTP pyrophosphatase [Actinomycetota bacterium]|nr:RdgB/HAM1 family non-canonical purine NTP pyrophosphatase [Actinomycetota bacterium]
MPDEVVVASKNPSKVREVEEVLASLGVHVVSGLQWPDVEETGGTLEENALLKARAVAEATGRAALADDTGLEVAALQGEPGVLTGRFGGPKATDQDNVVHLLQALEGEVERRARFRTVVALVRPDGQEVVAEGVLEGHIARSPRGEGGFGYDPVFEVEGRTLAELPIHAKHAVSHRGRALRALVERLG